MKLLSILPATSRSAFLRTLTVLTAIGVVSALAGCREEEKGRPLAYEKGTYQGQPDQPISDEAREQMRQRIKRQSFN